MATSTPFPTVVAVGVKGGYTQGVIDPSKNLTPETGATDIYCGANLPADLTGIGVTKNFQTSKQPYPTNSWLSQILRPPADVEQGSFYPLPFGVTLDAPLAEVPNTKPPANAFSLNVNVSQTACVPNLSPAGADGTVSSFAFGWIAGGTTPDWATSVKIFQWLQANPVGNPYLGVSGALLRIDLFALSIDLLGGTYSQYAAAIQGVLQNYLPVESQNAQGQLAPSIPVNQSAFAWISGASVAPNTTLSTQVFTWLCANPSGNPYLASTGVLLRSDFSSLAADLASSPYSANAGAIQAVLRGYLSPQLTVDPHAFAAVAGAPANWSLSAQIATWLQNNPSANPYLSANGVLLRPDLSSLATDLAGSAYVSYAAALQAILQNAITPQGAVPSDAFSETNGGLVGASKQTIFSWLKNNPAMNPYLASNGIALRTDLSNLPTELQTAGAAAADASAVQGVLAAYTQLGVINYLSKPAVDHHYEPLSNEWTFQPAASSGFVGRVLIDRYDPLSSDLVVSNGIANATLKVVRGSPLLTLVLPNFDVDLAALAYGSGTEGAMLPVLTLPSGDPGNSGLPTSNYFGITLNGNFWGVFQTPGNPCTFWNMPSGTAPMTQITASTGLSAAFVIRTQTQSVAAQATRCVTLALLPWDESPATRQATLDEFATNYAFNVVTAGSVDFTVSTQDCSVSTTFSLTLSNLLNPQATGLSTVLGLLPHHYNDNALAVVDQTQNPTALYRAQPGPRGAVCFYSGSSFTTQHRFPGVLPFLPVNLSTDQTTQLTALLDNFQTLFGASSENEPWYPGTWDTNAASTGPYAPFLPKDTYGAGKQIGALVQYAHAAEAAAVLTNPPPQAAAQAQAAQNAVAALLHLWLSAPSATATKRPAGFNPPGVTLPPGPDPFYYFAFEPNYRSMLGYPGSYGSTTALNDHHFHYGYFLSAAAWYATKDPSFIANYGGMIDLLAADIACTTDIQTFLTTSQGAHAPTFPIQRYFDVYEGHPWATGYQAPSLPGPQNEAATEALNSWIGMVLWGRIANRPAIEQAGIYLLATHAAGIAEYCFNVGADFSVSGDSVTVTPDADGNVGNCRAAFVNFDGPVKDPVLNREVTRTNPGWLYCTRLFGAGVSSGTDWQEFPIYRYTILWLPVTAGALYLGRYTAHNQAAFIQMQNAAAAEAQAYSIAGYPAWHTTPGSYWPALLNQPYTWATVTLPFAALSAGTGNFYFPSFNGWQGGSMQPLAAFNQWLTLANTDAAVRYPTQQTVDYQAAGVYFQEDGSSLASAYHFVCGLSQLGRPVFGGAAFDSVANAAVSLFGIFIDDVQTQLNLVAYNAGTKAATVQFSDSTGTAIGGPLSIPAGGLGQQNVANAGRWTFLSTTHTAMTLPSAKSGPIKTYYTMTGLVDANGKPWTTAFSSAGESYPSNPATLFLTGKGFSNLANPVLSVTDSKSNVLGTFGISANASSDSQLAIDSVPAINAGTGTYSITLQAGSLTSTLPNVIKYEQASIHLLGLVDKNGQPWTNSFPVNGAAYPANAPKVFLSGSGFDCTNTPVLTVINSQLQTIGTFGLAPGLSSNVSLAIDSVPAITVGAGCYTIKLQAGVLSATVPSGITYGE